MIMPVTAAGGLSGTFASNSIAAPAGDQWNLTYTNPAPGNVTATLASTSGCINWVGPATGGNWSTGANWAGGAVPGKGRDACLGAASVLMDSSLLAANQSINSFTGTGSLTIGNVNGPFTIAAPSTITNLTITAGSGLTGAGNLTISG
jgi:hypothetical protein